VIAVGLIIAPVWSGGQAYEGVLRWHAEKRETMAVEKKGNLVNKNISALTSIDPLSGVVAIP
jgi:hypothetical protein